MGKTMKLSTVLTLLFLILSSSAYSEPLESSIGIGMGVPYGGIGANYEVKLNDYIAPTVGLGWLPENVGWNVGTRIYFPGLSTKPTWRLTALYGTNTVLESGSGDYRVNEGLSAGFGFNWKFPVNQSFDADLFYTDPSVPDGYRKEGSEIKISLGFRWWW